MPRFIPFLALLSLLIVAPATRAGIVSWHASSGVLPSDPSIPPEHRFWLSGEPSFASMTGGLLNLDDTSDWLHVGFVKSDMAAADFDGDWAYQGELRVNSHSGPGFDWGVAMGFWDGRKRARLLVADNAVGFSGDLASSFLNGVSYAMDTTDDLHVYRVIKTGGAVALFVDTSNIPVIIQLYDDFVDDERAYVTMPRTAEFWVSNVDVRSFAYNLDGTAVPEPSTALLLTVAGTAVLRHRRRCYCVAQDEAL